MARCALTLVSEHPVLNSFVRDRVLKSAGKDALVLGGVCLFLAAVGCGPAPSPETEPEPPPPEWVDETAYPFVMGSGWEDYQAYADIGEVRLEEGFQGGQHINVSIRAHEVPATVDLRCVSWLVDPTLSEGDNILGNANHRDCSFLTYDQMFEFEDPVPGTDPAMFFMPFGRLLVDSVSSLLDTEVELRVHIEDSDGVIGRSAARGTLVWGPEPT